MRFKRACPAFSVVVVLGLRHVAWRYEGIELSRLEHLLFSPSNLCMSIGKPLQGVTSETLQTFAPN